MRRALWQLSYGLLGVAWLAAIVYGGLQVSAYDRAAGNTAQAPLQLPASPLIDSSQRLPTLVMLVHPHCPCSRASIGELTKIMTVCQGKLTATVLMLRPEGMNEGWEKTILWAGAAAIPGVNVRVDKDGSEAAKFNADTSGQVLLYAPDGRLLFSGGITESRGHSGDNAGESAVISLVMKPERIALSSPANAPVFGCSLFNPAVCSPPGGTKCPR
jgi:hypothetical protein